MAKFTIETARRLYLRHFAKSPAPEQRAIIAGLQAIRDALNDPEAEAPLFDAPAEKGGAEPS